MKKIYIATHGGMAAGIKDSLKLIAGDAADAITTYSLTPGKNANDFIEEIREEMLAQPETQFIILGDLFGASVVNAMFNLTTTNAVLLSGVNLGMALQVLLDTNETLSKEAIDLIVEESRKGIMDLSSLSQEFEQEDF